EVADEAVDTLGAFYTTLMMGLMAQWTFDPKTAPEAERLTEGLRRLMAVARAADGAP
ncbi:TetR/AcrR family transcriptional regulator, partial [Streptomyces sp. TRM76130]|nr:TetR/AcrR family transcriptional regulator [Streptomyces sp. TRM76130]